MPRILGRLADRCAGWNGLIWSYTVFLSAGPPRRAATESHNHFDSLERAGQRIAFPRFGADRTTGFTVLRISQIHVSASLYGVTCIWPVSITGGTVPSPPGIQAAAPSVGLPPASGGHAHTLDKSVSGFEDCTPAVGTLTDQDTR